jgi:hypothetical protein
MKSLHNCACAGARTQAVLRCAICLFLVLSRGVIVAEDRADVVVYGATPAGIAAAIAAAQSDLTVELIEPTLRIGGLVTSGLSHSDFRTFEALTGAFLGFAQRVEKHYARTYGPGSPQVRDSFRGTFGEPKVNQLVLEKMLAAHPSIRLRTRCVLDAVAITVPSDNRRRIDSARFRAQDGSSLTLRGQMFIDASYEGDLMARADVAWRAGREGRDELGESLAPEQADDQLQAYNFRFIMTRVATNHVAPAAPPGYRRDDFLPLLPVLASGQINRVFGYPRGVLFKAHEPPLPNGKYDINDVSGGLVRLSLPGANTGWPDGDPETRARIFAEHVRDNVGLLYFVQNDEAVPARFRDEAREWGWCRDEFVETGHLPPQLYVRQARRMQGVYLFTQRDSEHAPEDARAVLRLDAIAMGDYGNNCHGTGREGTRFNGRHTGEFYHPVPPYQIPYGVMLPRDVDNLLVPVAASSSHVGFCALRLEPIWMSLGQAAGHAAALAVLEAVIVQEVPVALLQRRLHMDGSATIYLSDVPPDSPDFVAAQWWGTHGGFHGLAPRPIRPGPRGRNIHGQYFEAFPDHAAELDQALTLELGQRWLALARSLGNSAPLPEADGRTTRRDFLRAAFNHRWR